MIEFSKEEIELFNAAKEYAFIVNKRLSCKPFHEKMMERKYEKSLERLGAACLDYAISVKSPPYDNWIAPEIKAILYKSEVKNNKKMV